MVSVGIDISKFTSQVGSFTPPDIELPWSGAISPLAADIEEHMMAWGDSNGMFLSNSHREQVARDQFHMLACKCHPICPEELLKVLADLCMWMFLLDDIFVDRADTLTDVTLSNLTTILNVIDLDKVSDKPIYGELATLDIFRRLRAILKPEPYQRFTQSMRLWLTSLGFQIIHQLMPVPLQVDNYACVRRYTSALFASLSLVDVSNGGSMDADDYNAPDVQQLVLLTNNIIGWTNDMSSTIVEVHQPGQNRNIVVVEAFHNQGLSLQKGLDSIASKIESDITAFLTLADSIQARTGDRLIHFIQGCKYWIYGNLDWTTKVTGRYSPSSASSNADARGLLNLASGTVEKITGIISKGITLSL